MRTADTSLAVAAFASWHDRHEPARRVLDGGVHLVEHCALETYSVLTRLPAPHRVRGDIVRDFIKARFPRPFLRLSAEAYRAFISRDYRNERWWAALPTTRWWRPRRPSTMPSW